MIDSTCLKKVKKGKERGEKIKKKREREEKTERNGDQKISSNLFLESLPTQQTPL